MELSTNFRFSGKKSQSQQKLATTIIYFTIQLLSENLIHFMNLNSLNIIKIYSRNTTKKMILVGVRKKIALHYF